MDGLRYLGFSGMDLLWDSRAVGRLLGRGVMMLWAVVVV